MDATMTSLRTRHGTAGACRIAAAALLAFGLAGCQSDRGLVTGSVYANDYRVRHPIALANAPVTLDIFAGRNAPGLDPRQSQDLRQFVSDYRANGRGPMMALVPRESGPKGRDDHRGAAAVRHALASLGVGGHSLQLTTYDASGQSPLASPVRLSFVKLQAKVFSECGDFSQDLGYSQGLESWQNKPIRNSGCAYQTAIAAQIDDPLDLQRPRALDRPDVMQRMKKFDDMRKGQDPSTEWKTESANVSGSVATGGN